MYIFGFIEWQVYSGGVMVDKRSLHSSMLGRMMDVQGMLL
jgi:hypothetical protein